MKQRKPLPRQRVPLKRTRLVRGRKPIPQMSARRQAEADRRAEVVAIVRARDKVCQAGAVHALAGVPCGGRLDCHEIIPRSVWRRGYLDVENVVLVCRKSHTWIDAHPHGAHALGLHAFSWERPA